jgi:DNA-binding CsgD family transcriptional regulator
LDPGPIGREAEITEICTFLSAVSGAPAALTIMGDAGIGKTVVWKHVVQAVGRSSRMLCCQPTPAERPLAFLALDDLFGDVAGEFLPELPDPQRRAVEIALLGDAARGESLAGLFEAGRPPPDRRLLARGILGALRALSGRSPVVIAIDDAQWLDRPSAGVLEFCFRRLQCESVSILVTSRKQDTSCTLGLDRALPTDRLSRLQLGPLSLGAIGEILRSRLGAALPRYTLTRLYEACGGNPFYALESARALADQPPMSPTSEPIPLPQSLTDLVRGHVLQLTADARRVGWLVAASADPRERLIRAACDDRESWVTIDQAIDEGIIERDRDTLRFTHPLLRSVLYAEMTLNQRREVHRRLGAAAEGIEERAWHLALGALRPSEEIAEMLDRAAEHAAERGAPEEAAAFEEQATRLTPAGRSESARERTVHAADYHFQAGDIARSRELIESVLATCGAEPLRAALLLRLGTIYYHLSGGPLAEQAFRQAAEEALGDPAVCAHAEQELAFTRLVAGDLPDAGRLAKTSLRSAEKAADPRLMAHSLARIAIFEFLQGHGTRLDLLDRAEALDATADAEPLVRLPRFDPSLVRALVLKWSDRLDEARHRLTNRYRHALDSGNEASLPFLLYHFSELECWAGNWDAAEEYALEACRVADESRQHTMRPATLYSLALVRAHRGHVEDARELASEALALCERTRNVQLNSMVLSILGFVELSLGDHHDSHFHLRGLAEATAAAGLGEPGVMKFLPDEIEALAVLGEADLAWSFTRQLQEQGRSFGRRWALATAARCHAYLASVEGDLEGALATCDQALSQHERLPMPFELGRTLLIKGMIERRGKHKPAARESLGQALAIFGHLGAPLWAAKAEKELSKIATRPSAGALTEAESHIAALVTQGRTNRQVAAALFVTENTVQTHIRHIFQKLSVKSRTELAARLLSGPASTAINTKPGM